VDWRWRCTAWIAGADIRVASIPHLIRLKEAAGRPQDLADIAQLRNLPGAQRQTGAMADFDPDQPPVAWGTCEDAEALRRGSFLQRTPEQRLAWLVSALELAYQSGALKSRRPAGEPQADWQGANARKGSVPI
jgi:hypothetical protein